MPSDAGYMKMAIDLAGKAEGMTSPNPAVGAVIVKSGKVVGKGYHKRCGLPHAEVNALNTAGTAARGGTLYVTLEPCCHFGRTPPCVDAIIDRGIKRVVIAMRDPNPLTDGRGIKRLRRAGIEVTVGVMEKEAAAINRPFTKFITKRMPYVTLKMAQSIDGKIATRLGDSRWVTSGDARSYVHSLRRKADAVMVGVETVIADDPELLPRGPRSFGKKTVRVIVDTSLRTPLNSKLLSDRAALSRSPVVMVTTRKAPAAGMSACAVRGATVLIAKSKGGRVDLRDMLKKLGGMEITDLLVEGGGELAASLIGEGLVDRCIFFIAPKIVGGRDAPTSVEGRGASRMKDALELTDVTVKRFSKDIMIEARIAPGRAACSQA